VRIGFFTTEDRLELLEGELVEKMSQKSPHSSVVLRLMRLFFTQFGHQYQVRLQMPLALTADSMPEPDIALVEGDDFAYLEEQPTTASLIIEVADTTLDTDRRIKSGLYAEAEIADYWIVNINDRVLEVHREPAPMSSTKSGYGYRFVRHYTEQEQIAPLFAPEIVLDVKALLPK